MFLKNLKLCNFRNFREKQFSFNNRFVVFEGRNGAGKSNTLESIYLLCTGKSYRNTRKRDLINFDADYFFIEGDFEFSASEQVSIALGYSNEKKSTYLKNSQKKESYLEWFRPPRPVLSFSSDDIYLVYGSPENRRKFLDFYGSLMDPAYLELLLEYRYWLKCKNVLLNSRFDEHQCDIYDEKLSVSGLKIIIKRYELIVNLKEQFNNIYHEISNNSELAEIVYNSCVALDKISKNDGKNVFYTMLHECRKKDLQLRYSSFGPHREDVSILLNGRLARQFSSQGQGRTLALSLKLASSVSLENSLQEQILYLIDDTVSELDNVRTDNFFPLIKNRGQVFMATPEGKFSRNSDGDHFRFTSED
jgi:DNA replication and repair protein RecF